jgi:aminoglycoside phosphotransferase (APT) family kinase protein
MSAEAGGAGFDTSVVDFAAVAAWMDDLGLPGGPIRNVRPLTGGTQNVMLRFDRGDGSYVLRRPPVHQRPKSGDALRKEARMLAALRPTPVRAPRVIAACMDETVLGDAVFYLMEPVDGVNPTTELTAAHQEGPEIRHEMGLDAAIALAELGATDHVALGLTDVGHPDGFLDRQVPQWLRHLASYREIKGYPGQDLPHIDQTARWLSERLPRAWRPGIMHGDYHLANLMYETAGPRVAAIVDWEMCTIGDPLLDLGWLLATWPDRGGAMPDGKLADAGGLPGRGELIDAYAARSARDLSAIGWYAVLACFKLGIVLEGTYARAFAGLAPREVGYRLHATTLGLLERARGFMDGDVRA